MFGFVVLFACKGKKNIWIVQGVGVRKGSGSIVSKPKTHTLHHSCFLNNNIYYIYIIIIRTKIEGGVCKKISKYLSI